MIGFAQPNLSQKNYIGKTWTAIAIFNLETLNFNTKIETLYVHIIILKWKEKGLDVNYIHIERKTQSKNILEFTQQKIIRIRSKPFLETL